MKNLIDSTETSATYEYTHASGSKRVTFVAPEPDENGEVVTPDFESLAEADHAAWLTWLGA
jgi:hypothetical protein